MKFLWPLCLVALLMSCQRAPHSAIRYTVGAPYRADGVWRYPAANFSYDATGIATVEKGRHAPLTADGEVYSARAIAAASPTLELPAIARVTNLENGRQVVVRINDRGPADPGRVIALTPAAARALRFGQGGTARVRVQILPGPSERLALALPGGPRVAVARAPVARVKVSELTAPRGAATGTPPAASGRSVSASAEAWSVADRVGALSEVAPDPGMIWVRTGAFTGVRYAALQAGALAPFGARVVSRHGTGLLHYEVRIGPFESVVNADTMLREVLRAGFTGAQLVVE